MMLSESAVAYVQTGVEWSGIVFSEVGVQCVR